MVHKDVGADQCNNMLLKLEEDAEVAYLEYEKAVKAEDRAESYVTKVNVCLVHSKCSKSYCYFSDERYRLEQHLVMRWKES